MVGVSSPASCRSRSTPRIAPVPVTASTSPSSRVVAPIRSRMPGSRAPGWVVRAGHPGTRTVPPATSAAAQERAGVGQVRLDAHVPGGDRPRGDLPQRGPRVVDDDAGVPQHLHGHLDVRQARQRAAGVPQLQPAAEPRGGQQQAGDELAGRGGVDVDRTTLDGARAGHRERQVAGLVVVGDRDVEGVQRDEHRTHRPGAGAGCRRRTGPARRRAPRPPGRKRMTVPARPQSISVPPRSGPGVTRQSDPSSSTSTPSARRASAMRRVSRERRAPRSRPGPSARAASTRYRLVRDFEPGTSTSASSGPAAVGAAQASSNSSNPFDPSAGAAEGASPRSPDVPPARTPGGAGVGVDVGGRAGARAGQRGHGARLAPGARGRCRGVRRRGRGGAGQATTTTSSTSARPRAPRPWPRRAGSGG